MNQLFYKFSTVSDGNMSYMFGDTKAVTNNRKKYLRKFGLNIEDCSGAYLKHSKRVVVAKHKGIYQSDYEVLPKADGLLTNENSTYLFMTFGDCLPVILHDPIKSAVGLIHAGWKGTDKEIVRIAVSKMKNLYKSDPKNIKAIIGPSIRKESYLFENPIQIEKDSVHNSKWRLYTNKVKNELYSIDLVRFNIDLLIDAGLRVENILDMKIDTARDPKYFSHYRDSRSEEGDKGRFACFVALL